MGTHPIFESDFDCLTVQNCPDWSKMANIGEIQKSGDFNLTPMSEDKVKSNSANWPLLLKGWDQLNVRSSHFTPIPAGCSPAKKTKQEEPEPVKAEPAAEEESMEVESGEKKKKKKAEQEEEEAEEETATIEEEPSTEEKKKKKKKKRKMEEEED